MEINTIESAEAYCKIRTPDARIRKIELRINKLSSSRGLLVILVMASAFILAGLYWDAFNWNVFMQPVSFLHVFTIVMPAFFGQQVLSSKRTKLLLELLELKTSTPST